MANCTCTLRVNFPLCAYRFVYNVYLSITTIIKWNNWAQSRKKMKWTKRAHTHTYIYIPRHFCCYIGVEAILILIERRKSLFSETTKQKKNENKKKRNQPNNCSNCSFSLFGLEIYWVCVVNDCVVFLFLLSSFKWTVLE